MDKREFYKQLMLQYTFDESKIRKNSKRRHAPSFANSRWMPLVSAAAVFIAVFASYTFIPPLLNGVPAKDGEQDAYPHFDAASFSAGGISSVSAGERLADMEYNDYLIRNNIMSAMEDKIMYVSFASPMTYNEYAAVLETYVSDTGEVATLSLWKDSFVELSAIDTGTKYLAAKIKAPASAYKKLLDCSVFSGVDFDNKINDGNFEPFVAEKQEEETTVASVTAASEVSETIPAVTTADVTDEKSPDVSEENAQTETAESEVPLESTLGASQIKLLSIPVSDVYDVEFINDDHFIVLTSECVALYNITDDGGYKLTASHEAQNPKITFANWGTNTMLILDEERTKLFIADGASCELFAVDTSEITKDASIACAYSGGEDVFIKTIAVDSSYNAFYLAVKGETMTIEKLNSFSDRTSVIGFNNESFVYALTDTGGATSFYKYNYRSKTEYELNIDIRGELSYVRSHDLTNFAILNKNERKAWIWNSQKDKLTEALETDAISFSEFNSDVYTDGTAWYEIWGSEMHILTEEEAAALSTKPILSSSYRINDITAEDLKFEIRR